MGEFISIRNASYFLGMETIGPLLVFQASNCSKIFYITYLILLHKTLLLLIFPCLIHKPISLVLVFQTHFVPMTFSGLFLSSHTRLSKLCPISNSMVFLDIKIFTPTYTKFSSIMQGWPFDKLHVSSVSSPFFDYLQKFKVVAWSLSSNSKSGIPTRISSFQNEKKAVGFISPQEHDLRKEECPQSASCHQLHLHYQSPVFNSLTTFGSTFHDYWT